MKTNEKTQITVNATVKVPVEKVWKVWTEPDHIIKWNAASEDWHTTKAENDVRTGGKFSSRMEAKDGSAGFDFEGIYDEVRQYEYIAYSLGDGRKVEISFENTGNETTVVETFEAEEAHSIDMQRSGWQAIMDNFKKYAESV